MCSRKKVFFFRLLSSFIALWVLLSADYSGAAKKASDGQDAVIKADNALVYPEPNFETDPVTSVPQGKKVRVSTKIFGSYFKFYKIRVGENQFGYISTIDVVTGVQAANPDGKKTSGKGKKSKPLARPSDAQKRSKRPFQATTWVGLLVGNLAFHESIPGIDATSNMFVYGIKVTGPNLMGYGPTSQVDIIVHMGAPDYYSQISSVAPSGYLIYVDDLLLIPLMQKRDSSVFLEGGPILEFTDFKFGSKAGAVEAAEFDIGLNFGFGAAFRLRNVGLRFEYNYLVSKYSLNALQFALQSAF